MWLLVTPEGEQPWHKQKRLLLPGGTYDIGRAQSSFFPIQHKSVSKRHCSIRLDKIDTSLIADCDARSVVRIVDLESKHGVFVNGEKLDRGADVVIEGTTAELSVLGAELFSLRWEDVVLTLSNVKPKQVEQACLELDLRYSKDYHPKTTHVVAVKVKTPKGIQALACGAYIVSIKWVNALLAAKDELVLDYDAGMPSPKQLSFLPDEDYTRAAEPGTLFPKQGGDKPFAGLDFVFFEQKPYHLLNEPLRAAGGSLFMCSTTGDRASIESFVKLLGRPVLIEPLDDDMRDSITSYAAAASVKVLHQTDILPAQVSDRKHDIFSAQAARLIEPREPPPRKLVGAPSLTTQDSYMPVPPSSFIAPSQIPSIATDSSAIRSSPPPGDVPTPPLQSSQRSPEASRQAVSVEEPVPAARRTLVEDEQSQSAAAPAAVAVPAASSQAEPPARAVSRKIGQRPLRTLHEDGDDDLFGNAAPLPALARNGGVSDATRSPPGVFKEPMTARSSRKITSIPSTRKRTLAQRDAGLDALTINGQAATSKRPRTRLTQEPLSPTVERTRAHEAARSRQTAEAEEASFEEPATPQQNIRRNRYDADEEVEESFEVAPAAAAIARQREQEPAAKRARVAPDKAPAQAAEPNKADKGAVGMTDDEIYATILENKKRKERESQAQASADAPIDSDEIRGLRNLGKVEFFPVNLLRNDDSQARSRRAGQSSSASDRWDPRWDGRKNFKKFRRSGTTRTGLRGEGEDESRIMIRLVVAQSADRALADNQWLDEVQTRDAPADQPTSTRSAANRRFPRFGRALETAAASNIQRANRSQAPNTDAAADLFLPEPVNNISDDDDDDPLRFRL